MERSIRIKIKGKEYQLVFTLGVMLDMIDRFGRDYAEAIFLPGEQSRQNAVCALMAMIEEAGRIQGMHIKPPVLDARAIEDADLEELRLAIYQAIELGMRRDVEDENVDLGLLELQKDKGETITRADVLYLGVTILGMTKRDVYQTAPGVLFDMFEIHQRRTGKRKQEDD